MKKTKVITQKDKLSVAETWMLRWSLILTNIEWEIERKLSSLEGGKGEVGKRGTHAKERRCRVREHVKHNSKKTEYTQSMIESLVTAEANKIKQKSQVENSL